MTDHADFVDRWRSFWAAPDPDRVAELTHPEMEMTYPGSSGPARGLEPWRDRIAGMLARFPDLTLEPTAFACNDEGLAFISWRGTATVGGVRRSWEGIDRMRLLDGLVVESLVAFDTAPFAAVGSTAE